jgi:Co/Zn/Cd efflux system component
MSAACCCPPPAPQDDATGSPPGYRRILWVALAINLTMFGVEVAAGLGAQSVSLLADSLDFLGDAANYGVSLFVLGMALRWRARASLIKGATMAAFGLWVIFVTARHAIAGTVPDAPVMGVVGVVALAANATVAALLYRFRKGDSNMASV